jgi:uncharacterized RDD family membrane protein YckC
MLNKYASFKIRFAAHIIDTLLLSCIVFIFIQLLKKLPDNNFSHLLIELKELISLIIGSFYYVALTAGAKKGTIGKNLLGIIVVGHNLKPLSLSQSFARYLAYYFSYLSLGLGFIMILLNNKKLALHDKIAETYVIYRGNNV